MSSAKPAQSNTKSNAPIDEDLPPQLHAGKVGYGPNYRSGPTLEEKVAGLKEELMGKVTHNRDRVQHGHEVRTGEEKRKKMTGEDEPNPFAAAEEDHSQSPAAGLKDNKPHDQINTNPTASEAVKTSASSSQHNTTSSTLGHKSTASAAHGQNANAQTTSSLKNGSTASDVNQSVPTSGTTKHTSSSVNDTASSDVNQSAPTPGTNKHTDSAIQNKAASDVNQSVPVPGKNAQTSSTVNKTPISNVNQSVPTSTSYNIIPKSTDNGNMPSAATNKNPFSASNTATSNNTSGHLGSNEHHSSPVTGHNDRAHGQPVSSDSDALSQSSYKPTPEKVTFNLNDKAEKERAATVAPKGTQAAEDQRTGGNVTENKYIN